MAVFSPLLKWLRTYVPKITIGYSARTSQSANNKLDGSSLDDERIGSYDILHTLYIVRGDKFTPRSSSQATR
ncbi:uncharacterized protein Bfra_008098 [Botrytis fragariae]|uniref:Uncharacterized protein n=1 Tax=Botrytis fragariae TaxID=1964551 RepID=A0A8H6AQF0_9HELO|nr:uncharacterized protein Bfra_008098 [Botrytis fragariae]KAF5871579.1 hypothetical protein Bfra_008098 [Botrytis fragariae]